MVKGIPIDNIFNSTKANPLVLTHRISSIFLGESDSLPVKSKLTNLTKDSALIGVSHKTDFHLIKSDSIHARKSIPVLTAKNNKTLPGTQTLPSSPDTFASRKLAAPPPYAHQYQYPENTLFLTKMGSKNPSKNFSFQLISKSDSIKKTQTVTSVISSHKTVISEPVTGFQGKTRIQSSLSWLPVVLLLSLFILSWTKILYHKYILQVVISIVNYQVALRLLRERNVLFRNMALGLNLIFIINLGLFVYFVFQSFNITTPFLQPILNFLLYCAAVTVFFNLKTFVCKILGVVFKFQEEFSEYTHNENLYNKNIGLILFPIIILFPYVPDNYKHSVLFSGIFLLGIIIFLRTLRGFQIIIRKGVSTFYMILYLCAIEILPVLLLLKYSMTLI